MRKYYSVLSSIQAVTLAMGNAAASLNEEGRRLAEGAFLSNDEIFDESRIVTSVV